MTSPPPDHARPRGARAGSLAGILPSWPPLSSLGGARFSVAAGHWRRQALQALSTEAERRRLFLWLPVMMGAGILLYFAADTEPVLWAPLAGLALAGVAATGLRDRRLASLLCLALCAMFAGFAAATWRTAQIAAPLLERPRVGQISGFVESVEARDAGARLVVLLTGLAGVEPERWPKRARVNIRAGTVSPGDHISAMARLLPPPGPARPGGYDFGRDAFFRGIGAVGNISGTLSLTPPPRSPPFALSVTVAIDRARNALTQRIASVGGGQAGAMAASLVTGKRGLITETTNTDLRAAGIYHIISI